MEEKDQLESHDNREEIQREGIEKLLLETNTPHICTYSKCLKQNLFFFFLEKAYTSEIWSALDNSQKLMSAYVLYKIDFQTIFG